MSEKRKSGNSVDLKEKPPLVVPKTRRQLENEKFSENLTALMMARLTFDNRILCFKLRSTASEGPAKDIGLEDILVNYMEDATGLTYRRAFLIVNEMPPTSTDERLNTSPSSPADLSLLARYFKYYRIMRNGMEKYCQFCTPDEIIVYWNRKQDKRKPKKNNTVFNLDYLEDSEECDPLFGGTMMKLKTDFEGKKELMLKFKDVWIYYPKELARLTFYQDYKFHGLPDGSNEGEALLRCYRSTYEDVVLDKVTGLYRQDFVIGKDLTPTAKHIRDSMLTTFLSLGKINWRRDEKTFEKTFKVVKNKTEGSKRDSILGCEPGLLCKIARRMAEAFDKSNGNICISINTLSPIVKQNLSILLGYVLDDVEVGFVFRKGFVSGGWLPKHMEIFRKSLKMQVQRKGIDFRTLREYLFFNPQEIMFISDIQGDLMDICINDFLAMIRFVKICPTSDELRKHCEEELEQCKDIVDPAGEQEFLAKVSREFLDFGSLKLSVDGEDLRGRFNLPDKYLNDFGDFNNGISITTLLESNDDYN